MAANGRRLEAVLDVTQILPLRLANQHLLAPQTGDPRALVAHLGAVQSQDFAAALWALGMRLADTNRAALECAFNSGAILRTHVLRPTWHFVAPADIRWMLALTGPRIKRAMAARDRELGLDDAAFERSNMAIARALEGGKHMTRSELNAVLAAAGVAVADGSVLSHLLSHAEIDSVTCSGAVRGKVHTHALVDERVPRTAVLTREEAVAELVRRYFTSHGPATLSDFAWWSGLTVGDGRSGLAAHGTRFESVSQDGLTYWFDASTVSTAARVPTTFLLPNYDEFTVAYRERALFFPRQVVYRPGPRDDVPFSNVIVIDGIVEGFWKRAPRADQLALTPVWLNEPSARHRAAFGEAAERYAAFLGLPLVLNRA